MNLANPPLLTITIAPFAGAARRSERMLCELLALNEEMIIQLRLERLSSVGTTDFIASMIQQHETAAERLRTQLQKHESRAVHSRGRDRELALGHPIAG